MNGGKRNDKGSSMKLWEKGTKLNQQIENFTVGEDYILDQKLVKYDCLASIAHAKITTTTQCKSSIDTPKHT